jgi:FimV-like protein
MNQRSPHEYFLLGETLYERGQFEDAATAWRAAMVGGDPVLAANAAMNAGTALKRIAALDEAEQAYAIALTHKLEDTSSRAGIALAELRAERGDLPGAAETYRVVLSLEDLPHLPQAALNLGVTARQLGDLEEALGAFRFASELTDAEPSRSMAMLNLGLVAAELKLLPQARDAFQVVTDWGDEDLSPKAKLNLGLAHLEMGDKKKARSIWSELVDSGHPVVAPQARHNVVLLDEGVERKDGGEWFC